MLTRVANGDPLALTVERIKEINRVVLHGLCFKGGVNAGELRTYSVGVMTYRGVPWQECEPLLVKLCDCLKTERILSHMEVCKAAIWRF